MPTNERINALDNPRFTLWDYGTAAVNLNALPAHGYIANRFKAVGSGYEGNISRATSTTNTIVPAWLRNKNCMRIALTNQTAGASLIIRQVIEDGQSYARNTAILTVIATATAGRHFYIGVNGAYTKATGLGPDNPVTVVARVNLPDLPLPQMDVDIFKAESVGTFDIMFTQLEMSSPDGKTRVIEIPQARDVRQRAQRYARPIRQGLPVKAVSATRVIGIDRHPEEMRTAPTLVNPLTVIRITALTDGAATDNNAATVSIANASAQAARIIIDGFTGLTIGNEYMLSTNNIGILHADY